jgi:hypothetical protein
MGTDRLGDNSILGIGPVAVAGVAWRFRGAVQVTTIAKATFAFAQDAPMRQVAPQAIVHADVHRQDNPGRSVALSSDLAPYLPLADVLLSGTARALPDATTETLTVRLGLFNGAMTVLDKKLLVRQKGGVTNVPLIYERAYGGVGFPGNPLGLGATEHTGEPSIFYAEGDRRVAGFGPIPRTWPERKHGLGGLSREALDPSRVLQIPDAFDWECFQSAPADQRVGYLRGDEWIVVDGVHPTLRPLRTRLPGARAHGRVYGLAPWGVAEGKPLALHADMLRIDCDDERCTLTFRATFPVAREAALPTVHVVLGVELPGQSIEWPDRVPPVANVDARVSSVPPSRTERAPRKQTLVIHEDDTFTGILSLDPSARTAARGLPAQWDASAPSALRQATGTHTNGVVQVRRNPLEETISQGPETCRSAAEKATLPFLPVAPLVAEDPTPRTPPGNPPVPQPTVWTALASCVVSQPNASPWAPPPVTPDPDPAPRQPSPLLPSASPELRKGLYGKFSGQH